MIVRTNRLFIKREHLGKGVVMVFPCGGSWHVIEHDVLVEIVGTTANYLNTPSWLEHGGYSTGHPNRHVREALQPYRVPPKA